MGKRDAGSGDAMMFKVGQGMLVMRKCAVQGFIARMFSGIVPPDPFASVIWLVTVGTQRLRQQIEQFPHIKHITISKTQLALHFCHTWPNGISSEGR